MIYVPWRVEHAASQDLTATFNAAVGGPDQLDHAWAFDEAQGQIDAKVPPDYTFTTKSKLTFIRPFVNGKLMLYDPSSNPSYSPRDAAVHIALDSNLQTPFTNFILSRKMRAEWSPIITELFTNGIAWNAQFEPMPYLIENLTQYESELGRQNAEELIQATIVANNLDPAYFQATGQVKMRAGFDDDMIHTWGTSDTAEAASRQFKAMRAEGAPVFTNLIMHDLSVMKLVEIGLTVKKYDARVEAFDNFLKEVTYYRPSLLVIGRLFFHGKLGGLLKANVGDRNFKVSHLHSAAYDLFITAIPDQILGISDMAHPQLTIIATCDAPLGAFASRFPTRGIAIGKDGLHRLLQDWDEAWLDDLVGKTQAEEIRKSVNVARVKFGELPLAKNVDELRIVGAGLKGNLQNLAS